MNGGIKMNKVEMTHKGCGGVALTLGYNGNLEYLKCAECEVTDIYNCNKPWLDECRFAYEEEA
tara:strand:- start:5 stop:193 length:189 start_codon:yes stop_codon:yes gene_type:complete